MIITKIRVINGKIHIYEGKVSYIFSGKEGLREMANRSYVKPGDEEIKAAASNIFAEIESLPDLPDQATINALEAIENRIV